MAQDLNRAIASIMLAHGDRKGDPEATDDGHGDGSQQHEEWDGPHEGHIAAAEDMMKAMKEGNHQEAAAALHHFCTMTFGKDK